MNKEKLLEWIEIKIDESNVDEYIWALEAVRDKIRSGEFDNAS